MAADTTTLKARKRDKPKKKALPAGYGNMDTKAAQKMKDMGNAGATGNAVGSGLGLLGGLATAAIPGIGPAIAPIAAPLLMKMGGGIGQGIGDSMSAQAEADFAAEQAAKDAAFAMQQFEYQRDRDEYEYDDAVQRQNIANAVKDTPRLESMNIIPQFRRGR
jgi:hypothetical protein